MKVTRYKGRRPCICWRPAAFLVESAHGDASQVMLLCLRCADALVGGVGAVYAEHREDIEQVDEAYQPPPPKE